MAGQFCRLDFYQIGFHVFDNAIADLGRQLIDHGGMNRRRRGKRPAVFPFPLDDFDDAVGQLLADPSVIFIFDSGSFGYRIHLPRGGTARESAGLVGHFILVTAVGVGGIERLD